MAVSIEAVRSALRRRASGARRSARKAAEKWEWVGAEAFLYRRWRSPPTHRWWQVKSEQTEMCHSCYIHAPLTFSFAAPKMDSPWPWGSKSVHCEKNKFPCERHCIIVSSCGRYALPVVRCQFSVSNPNQKSYETFPEERSGVTSTISLSEVWSVKRWWLKSEHSTWV